MRSLVPTEERDQIKSIAARALSARSSGILIGVGFGAGMAILALSFLSVPGVVPVATVLFLVVLTTILESRASRRAIDPAHLTRRDIAGLEWIDAFERGNLERARMQLAELEMMPTRTTFAWRATVGDLAVEVAHKLLVPRIPTLDTKDTLFPAETPTPVCPAGIWLGLLAILQVLSPPPTSEDGLEWAAQELMRRGLTDRLPFIAWVTEARIRANVASGSDFVLSSKLTPEQHAAAKRLFPAAEDPPDLGPYRTLTSMILSEPVAVSQAPDWERLERLLVPRSATKLRLVLVFQGLLYVLLSSETRAPVATAVAGGILAMVGLAGPTYRYWRLFGALSKALGRGDLRKSIRLLRATLRPRTLAERLRVVRVALAATAVETSTGSEHAVDAKRRLWYELEGVDSRVLAVLRLSPHKTQVK